jgi:hypothetical protein
MNPYRRITHKGQEILYFDYKGLRGKEVLEQLQANTRVILDSPETDFLTLSDFRNVYADEESMAYLQSEEVKAAARKTKKKAVLGITGLKKMFLNLYNTFTGIGTRAFDDEETAKEYLVS